MNKLESIRRKLSRLTDRDLLIEYAKADIEYFRAEYNYRYGIATVDQMRLASFAAETKTVAKTIGRERLLGGGHSLLTGSFTPSPKETNRVFGRKLRRKRGIAD